MSQFQFTDHMNAIIQSAALKAKFLFDTYHWTWSNNEVPSIGDIIQTYELLVQSCWQQSSQIENGEEIGSGNASTGHLTVEFVDYVWVFGIQLSMTTGNPEDDGIDEQTYSRFANERQLNQ